MKKIAIAVFAVLSVGYFVSANAAPAALAAATAGVETPVTAYISNTECGMVSGTSQFNVTPSRNVGIAYKCDTTAIAVNTGNTKGKYTYGGSSNGGSVAQCGGGTPVAVDTSVGYKVAAPDPTKDGCS